MKIAVIGAGPAGLVAAKELAACGHEPVILERSNDIGGLWNEAKGPTWVGMRTNLSKYNCAFSDKPHSSTTEDFPDVATMHKYLVDYAQYFNITKEILFGHSVHLARPEPTGWEVSFTEPNGYSCSRFFDGLVVGSGFFSRGPIPQLPGMENFKGRVLHSSDYRDRQAFSGKNVVVIGNGLTGVEICADVSQSAKSVTHIARRKSWIIPRYLTNPTSQKIVPLDILFYRRKSAESNGTSTHCNPNIRRNRTLATLSQQNDSGVQALYIDPDSSQFFPIAISDNYVRLAAAGQIKIVSATEIRKVLTDKIDLGDDNLLDADIIIFATGYQFDLPYFSDTVKAKLGYQQIDQLQPTIAYQSMFIKDYPTLALVGAYKGPYFCTMELQARLASQIFSSGPSFIEARSYEAEMEAELKTRRNGSINAQFPHPDFVSFADSLASAIGCMPQLDPAHELYSDVYGGPVIPAHYRLSGPGAAKHAAHTQIVGLRQILSTATFPRRITIWSPEMKLDITNLQEVLKGEWHITRDATDTPQFFGTAIFCRKEDMDQNALLYREDMNFPIKRGHLHGFREYIYVFGQDSLQIRFTKENPNPEEIFMNLNLMADKHNALTASDLHRCGCDDYTGTFTFINPNEFHIKYRVKGPRKDYEISSVYLRA